MAIAWRQFGQDWGQAEFCDSLFGCGIIEGGKRSCYTWVFSTATCVLFRYGIGRGKIEAEEVLGKFFSGIGVTDDYAAYKILFSKHQLCWAHLIRKAIKLALQHSNEKQYAVFLDDLCEIYRQAVHYRKDRRLSVGRATKTPAGARRRGVIMTVLASLQTRFAKFTLKCLLSEVQRWLAAGHSIFESELAELQKANPPPPAEPVICPNG